MRRAVQHEQLVTPGSIKEWDAERWYRLWLIGILLLGWALRIYFWWQGSRSGVVPPASDEEEYYRGAVHIFKELGYYDRGQWLRGPLPSLLLAVCFFLAGGIYLAPALLMQALFSGLAVLPIARVARSYTQSRRAGIVAGLLAALYIPHAVMASQMMSEPAAILTIALCFFCLERWRAGKGRWWLFWAGVALSGFTLARAMGLYAQVLVLVWVWWRVRTLRQVVRLSGLFMLGFWLVLAPWSIRNTLVFGRVVLVDTNAGFTFWSGTDEPQGHEPLQVLWNETVPNLADKQALEFSQGIANIRRDPAAWLLASRSKVGALWELRVRLLIANGLQSLLPATNSVPLTLIADAMYLLIAASTILYLAFMPQPDPHWMLILWPFYGSALSAVSLGHPRLRIALEVSLFILGAYPLAHPRQVCERIREACTARRLVSGGALLLFALLIYSSAYPAFVRSQIHLAAASVADWSGNRQRALAETEAAVRAEPETAIPLLALAQQQASADETSSIATLERVVWLDSNVLPAHAVLLELALRDDNHAAIAQRLEGIRAIRRDDNRLYSWLWAQNARQPRDDLEIGSNADLGLVEGVGEPVAEAGMHFRWTQAHTRIRMQGGAATRLHLQLRAWHNGSVVHLLADGRPIGECLLGLQWATCAARVPAHIGVRIITIQTDTAVPWPPGDYLPRGVALARIWLAP